VGCHNPVVQLFSLFAQFLYTIQFDSRDNFLLHNIFVDSRRIYRRELMDFFRDEKTKPDDLNYRDFIDTVQTYAMDGTENFRTLVNQQTAHFTKRRGTVQAGDAEQIQAAKQLVDFIYRFMQELDSSAKEEYREAYQEPSVQKLRSFILSQIINIRIRGGDGAKP
jgi:hypothetical protein